MDISESLWDARTPLEQLLSMGFCFGLFLLMVTATYMAYFSATYNRVNTKHVFGMEFDVCTKEVCIERGETYREDVRIFGPSSYAASLRIDGDNVINWA